MHLWRESEMSQKRYSDARLEGMTRRELLVYAKTLTREHGRAQASINRLIAKLRMWERGTPPAPYVRRTGAVGPVQHRRWTLREVRRV